VFEKITFRRRGLGRRPCIRDTGIPVALVLHMLSAGKTAERILAENPLLLADDFRTCLRYGAWAASRSRWFGQNGVRLCRILIILGLAVTLFVMASAVLLRRGFDHAAKCRKTLARIAWYKETNSEDYAEWIPVPRRYGDPENPDAPDLNISRWPRCPSGGTYRAGRYGDLPTCSVGYSSGADTAHALDAKGWAVALEQEKINARARAAGLTVIIVDMGHVPTPVYVAAYKRRLLFDCGYSTNIEIVFPSLGIRRTLRGPSKVEVDLPTTATGEIPFTYGDDGRGSEGTLVIRDR
jgi:uncharacterized protein (DUF433 family)